MRYLKNFKRCGSSSIPFEKLDQKTLKQKHSITTDSISPTTTYRALPLDPAFQQRLQIPRLRISLAIRVYLKIKVKLQSFANFKTLKTTTNSNLTYLVNLVTLEHPVLRWFRPCLGHPVLKNELLYKNFNAQVSRKSLLLTSGETSQPWASNSRRSGHT